MKMEDINQYEEILKRTIRKGGTSALIFVPKRYEGKEAVVMIKKDTSISDGNNQINK